MEHNTPQGPSQHPLKTKHSVPLLTTAAGLALVTTTTLFSMSASTAAVADVYARTGRVSMAWLCRPPCRSHIPPLSSPSVIPSQGATASQVIPPQHLETKRRRGRWAEGMHVLFMTRSRGGMGKGGQEQGGPEGKGGGGGGGGGEGGRGRGEGVWAQNLALTGKNSSSSVGGPSLLASDLAPGGVWGPSTVVDAVAGGSLGPVAKTLAGSSQSHASPSTVPSFPSSPSSPHLSKTLAAQQRRQKAKDQRIFKKIVDSQTTAAVPLHLGGRGREEEDVIWGEMKRDAEMECRKEPLLVSYMYCSILNHKSLEQAVAFHMATKLATPSLIGTQIESLFAQCFEEEPLFSEAIRLDMVAVMDRDPACRSYLDALLYFKGFQALQTHRVAHWLWKTGRDTLAFYLQSQINQLFQIDIHPAARIGSGVFIDHGTGIVIGETAVVGHNVSMLHMVTLGGSGKKHVDRHPKIGDGVLLGAGATILGNVQVGKGSLVGACSLVLEDIGPNSVAVGVPAKVVGQTTDLAPAESMRQADAIVMVEDDLPDFII